MRWTMLGLLLAGTVACAEPPAPAPAASKGEIGFAVTQMGVSVSGRFSRFDARIAFDPARPDASSAGVTVDVTSLTTGDSEADATALDRPWLDAASFPKATFKSSTVRALGPGRYEVKGTLTLRGKPREITVPFTTTAQPDGSTVAGGSFALKRTDFGIGGGEWDEADVVANEVLVRFKLVVPPAR